MRRLSCALLLAALASACAPTPVEVDLAFPSRETFLYSDFGRLLVYEVELGAPTQDCPALIDRVAEGDLGEPIYDSDWAPVCDFRARTVAFSDIPPGPHAYVGLTRDSTNTVLLTGCHIAEAYEGAPTIPVRLFPTANYTAATRTRTLACPDEEAKCRTGC